MVQLYMYMYVNYLKISPLHSHQKFKTNIILLLMMYTCKYCCFVNILTDVDVLTLVSGDHARHLRLVEERPYYLPWEYEMSKTFETEFSGVQLRR